MRPPNLIQLIKKSRMQHNPLIREALAEDVNEMIRIWRDGSLNSLGFAVEVKNVEKYFLDRVDTQDETFKIWVAEEENGSILGWQSLQPVRNNPALRSLMAESSTYIDKEAANSGVGTALLARAMSHADQSALQYVIGFARSDNAATIRIAEKNGWEIAGELPEPYKPPAGPGVKLLVYRCKSDT